MFLILILEEMRFGKINNSKVPLTYCRVIFCKKQQIILIEFCLFKKNPIYSVSDRDKEMNSLSMFLCFGLI